MSVSEKRRFIKREVASKPADHNVEPSKITSRTPAAAAAAAVIDDVSRNLSAKSIINGHTSVECQPSE